MPGTCGLPGGGEYAWLASGLALSPKEGEKGSQEEFSVPDPRHLGSDALAAGALSFSRSVMGIAEAGGRSNTPDSQRQRSPVRGRHALCTAQLTL